MKTYTYTHRTQYYETDQMGVVHHSNYIRWFEEARTYFLEEIGLPYDYMERELKIISPVLEVSCQYRSMVRFGDTVNMIVSIESYNGVRFSFSYQIQDQKTGEIRTIGSTRHCFLNEKGLPISMKKSYPEIHKLLSECM